MTIDKERLRVLAEGATPGPWGTIERGPFWGESEGDVIDHYGADVVGAEHVAPLGTQETTRGQMWLRDAEFIAAARDAVPALLAENAALAAEVERTSNNRDMWKAQCAAQAKELERLRKDAARYLRIRNGPHSDRYGDLYAMQFQGDGDMPTKGSALDAAADAAIVRTDAAMADKGGAAS